MKITRKIFVFCAVLTVIAVCAVGYVAFVPHNVANNNTARPDFITYQTGQEIIFNQSGNSLEYTKNNIGWGGQEPKHRCIVGKNAELKLFVSDADGSDMRLMVNASGVRAPEALCQNITVYANDTVVADWCAASRDIYTAIIPASVFPDGNLHIRFNIAAPYVSAVDSRALGAAVRDIKLEKIRGNQTKKKFSLWLQTKLWGGPVQNPYATNDNQTEKSK